MIDQATITDTPQPAPEADPRVPALEERVRHLEEAVTALQDTRALEERVVERVAAQVAPAGPNGARPSAGFLLEAGRQLLPAAVGAISASAPAAEARPAAQPLPSALRRPWLLFDVYAEFRALLRMYLDPRFRLTWAARLAPLVLLPAIATSWIWLPGTSILPSFVSTLVMKAVDLVLTFALFHVLHREVTRYRATSPDLPPSLRLSREGPTMIRLGVNIDHVATVRQARRAAEPDPVAAAVLALLGGADGITVHLREDRRHIQDRDVRLLRPVVTSRLNLEMAVADEIVAVACEVKPDEATLVPEKRQELTTEGGLDVAANEAAVGAAVRRLKGAGIEVSLFLDPDPRQIEVAKLLGVQAVEIHTGRYADARGAEARARELAALKEAAAFATGQGLHVHMGHGLNYGNVQAVARIPGVEELNIGHSIVARAVLVGLERAVREMKEAIV